jgi:hypothetical protein
MYGSLVEALEPSHGGVAGKEEGYSMRSNAFVHEGLLQQVLLNQKLLFI